MMTRRAAGKHANTFISDDDSRVQLRYQRLEVSLPMCGDNARTDDLNLFLYYYLPAILVYPMYHSHLEGCNGPYLYLVRLGNT